MNKQTKLFTLSIASIIIAILATACNGINPDIDPDHNTNPDPNEEQAGVVDTLTNIGDIVEDSIENQVFTDTVRITYTAAGASIDGLSQGATQLTTGITIEQNEASNVIIRSTRDAIVYILTGQGTGSFKLYSEQKYSLILNNLTLANPNAPALNLQSKKKAYVVLQGENELTDGTSYATELNGEAQKACLFAEGQMIFSGTGKLTIHGNNHHALASDDYVRIMGGTLDLTAVADGIRANDGIILDNGNLTIAAGDNALQCDENSVVLTGGKVQIRNTGTSSKGVKAYSNIELADGVIDIVTTGKGFHSTNGNIVISGGDLSIQTSGANGKGLHATSGEIRIAGGETHITTTGNPASENGEMVYAKGIKAFGNLTVSGGKTIVKVTGKRSSSSSSGGWPGQGGSSDSDVEGVESKADILISGGEIAVTATDDAINSANNMRISGGRVYACSSGNDGIDSNGAIYISGGVVVAIGASSPEEGIDTDNTSNFHLTGGTVIAVGGSVITPAGNTTSQYNLKFSGSSNTAYNISASNNAEVMNFKLPTLSYTPQVFATCPAMQNVSYTISKGVTISGTDEWYGLYLDATHTGGSTSSTVTATLTSASSGPGGNPGGGNPGGRP